MWTLLTHSSVPRPLEVLFMCWFEFVIVFYLSSLLHRGVGIWRDDIEVLILYCLYQNVINLTWTYIQLKNIVFTIYSSNNTFKFLNIHLSWICVWVVFGCLSHYSHWSVGATWLSLVTILFWKFPSYEYLTYKQKDGVVFKEP